MNKWLLVLAMGLCLISQVMGQVKEEMADLAGRRVKTSRGEGYFGRQGEGLSNNRAMRYSVNGEMSSWEKPTEDMFPFHVGGTTIWIRPITKYQDQGYYWKDPSHLETDLKWGIKEEGVAPGLLDSFSPKTWMPDVGAQAKDAVWSGVDERVEKITSQGWFSGFWGKVTLVFWLIVGGLVAFIALCVMGTINRILGRGN